MDSTLTADTQAVLLLCGQLGQRGSDGPKPLGRRQYNALTSWLESQGLQPGDLLSSDGRDKLAQLHSATVNSDDLTALLNRGAALALMAEKWERSGLWVISRSDEGYPERLKAYLGQSAPPLLYGVGCQDLLNRGGLAVVGSRDRSEEDGEYARRVGEHCATEGIPIISGAAKGIDRDAMSGALESGGWALGVLAEGLAKTATSGQYRSGLMSDRLTLISPFEPDSRWFAHAAMERNKLLYGLSDAALVVASAAETGGTWAGATEALKRGRVKVFVKDTGTAAPGNAKLLRRGGVAFPPEPWENLRELLTPPEDNNRQLFSEAEEKPAARTDPDAGRETTAHVTSSQHSPCDEGRLERAPEEEKSIRDAYALVIDRMLALLEEPRTTEWVAGEMDVRSAQMKIWLERAAREGRIRKLRKPVRYVANSPGLFRG